MSNVTNDIVPIDGVTSILIPGISTPEGLSRKFDLRTPEGWRDKLLAHLDERAPRIALYDAYYRGAHRLQFAGAKFKTAFGSLFQAFADNWCPIVVDAVEERLNVEGFRLVDDVVGDKEAWRIWQANQLDAYSQVAHTEALIGEQSYALVSPSPGVPLITVEHPSQTIVYSEPSNRRARLAALKKWDEDDGTQMVTLYMADWVYKWTKPKSGQQWAPREVTAETWPLRNPFNVVPVIPLVNRPRLLTGGESELASVIPLQDAVNKLIADMLVASEFGAFRQRWATGIEVPVDPVTNQPLEPFAYGGPGTTTIAEDPQATFGEFSESNLQSYVTAVEMLVQHAASQTRTPPHYFYLRGEFPSGESIKSAETGLVAKAHRKMRHFGEAWEEVMRLAFTASGNARGGAAEQMEVIWGDPESRTESEHVDAIVKKQALGLPDELLWEQLGMTPTEITRAKVLRVQQSAMDGDMAAEELVKRATSAGVLIRSGFDPSASLTAVGLDPIRHSGLLPVTVQTD